jgi:hypothetical protein
MGSMITTAADGQRHYAMRLPWMLAPACNCLSVLCLYNCPAFVLCSLCPLYISPIVGQLEVSCHHTGLQDANAHWVVDDGIFFPVREAEDQ